MPRVKRGKTHLKRRKNIMAQTKGYMWGRKSKLKLAQVAILKAGKNAYRDRRAKKRDMRGLWQIKINAGVRQEGTTYSKFMGAVHKADIVIDRKIMAVLAEKYPEAFKAIIAASKVATKK
jgi:large subunit ribosomal protein L20